MLIRSILVFILLFASCSKKEQPVSRQVVRLSLASDPSSLDPRKARDLYSGVVLRMLFEGLMRTAKDGSLENGVAEHIQVSDDGLTYTFTLKEMNWSNESPLTSSDFLFAWKSLLDPNFPSDTAYFLYPIKNAKKAKLGDLSLDLVGISAPDAKTLVVELEEPTPYFLELLTAPAFFPVAHESIKENWEQEAATIVTNGPFCVDTWEHANKLLLRKNKSYWDEKDVHLDGIDFCVLPQDTEFRSFEDNKLDWAGSPLSAIPRDAMVSLKEQNKLETAPFLATQICRINTTLGGPLSNALFRKALALSIDRSAITEHILQGGQAVATGLVPPEISTCKAGYFSDHSVQEAKELLDQVKDQFPAPKITLSYYNSERNRLIAQTLQAQWESNLGITVSLEAVEPKVFFQKVSRREFQIAMGSWVADFSDPINFLEVFKYKDNGTNNTGWESSEYIDLLNQSALCSDPKERREILGKAEHLIIDEMPIIPIFHFTLNYVKNDALTGAFVSPQGFLNLRCASFKEPKH